MVSGLRKFVHGPSLQFSLPNQHGLGMGLSLVTPQASLRDRALPLLHCLYILLYVGTGLGHFGGRDEVIYWKCEEGQILDETLSIPMTNVKREEALITAAHQQVQWDKGITQWVQHYGIVG